MTTRVLRDVVYVQAFVVGAVPGRDVTDRISMDLRRPIHGDDSCSVCP